MKQAGISLNFWLFLHLSDKAKYPAVPYLGRNVGHTSVVYLEKASAENN